MTNSKPVLVKQFLNCFDEQFAESFRELRLHMEGDRPYIVFDFAGVGSLDSAGIEFLLMCMEESMKRNGDVKLASVSPELAAILKMTRVDRLFEIFENCNDAVESFHRFLPDAVGMMTPMNDETQRVTNRH
jgi:anti-sigma B factor antagonist